MNLMLLLLLRVLQLCFEQMLAEKLRALVHDYEPGQPASRHARRSRTRARRFAFFARTASCTPADMLLGPRRARRSGARASSRLPSLLRLPTPGSPCSRRHSTRGAGALSDCAEPPSSARCVRGA